MRGYISRLRRKTRAEQSRAAFVVAALVTFVVAIVWAFSLPVRLASTVPQNAALSDAEPVGQLLESTKSNIEDIVRTAETLRNADFGTVGSGTPSGQTASGSATQADQDLPLAIPRKVLIATSSSEKTE